MATTVNQIIKRKGRDGKKRTVPVAAGKNLLAGTYAFLDANGRATDVKVDANTVFAGVVYQQADNTGGGAGDINVELLTDGDFEMPITLTNQADVGDAVHASDNYTATLTTTNNPRIGTLTRFITTGIGEISIHGLGEAVS